MGLDPSMADLEGTHDVSTGRPPEHAPGTALMAEGQGLLNERLDKINRISHNHPGSRHRILNYIRRLPKIGGLGQ
jgi:hypothetical protein